MRYPVGTKFTQMVGAAPKVKRECVVVDYHTTRNLAGEIVRERYVVAHEFLGQTITESDICETTIARALWK